MGSVVVAHWSERPEGGSRFSLAVIRWLILHVGRGFARVCLVPVSLYFFARRGVERRASRQWLRRADAPRQGHIGVLVHIFTFATTIVDRVLLLAGRGNELDIRSEGMEDLVWILGEGKGCVLLGSHLGSFEAIRVFNRQAPPECQALKVVMDRDQNSLMTQMLEELSPEVRETVIDARQSGPQIVLEAADALADGSMVAMLADRTYRDEPTAPVEFLGGAASLPLAPLAIASTLDAPVFTVFGLFEGGRRYRLVFERLDKPEMTGNTRGEKRAGLNQWVANYAQRLEYYARQYPYNWFNFYDFWNPDRPAGAGERRERR